MWVEGHSDSQTINTPGIFVQLGTLQRPVPSPSSKPWKRLALLQSACEPWGLAATQPLEDNSTAEGRARNRRVEVVIHVE